MTKGVCEQCGRKIDPRAKRCNSCAAKQRIKEGNHHGWTKENLSPNTFKKGECDKKSGLQFPKTAKEKRQIRISDNSWFLYWCGEEFREKYEIDHDWQNGAYCRLLTHKEHIEMHKRRKSNGF